MFKFAFAEFNSFLDTLEKTYQSLDEHCLACENAMIRMERSGFCGLSATAADIKFFSWYDRACANSRMIVLLHDVGLEILNGASHLKNTSENIAAAIGAPAKCHPEWTYSEVAVDGRATSLSSQVQGIRDNEIASMEATLSSISDKLFFFSGTATILDAVNSLRLSLANQKDTLSLLKSATDIFTSEVADFEARYAVLLLGNNAEIPLSTLGTTLNMEISGVALRSLEDNLGEGLGALSRKIITRVTDSKVHKILSGVGVTELGVFRLQNGYIVFEGYTSTHGIRLPSRILPTGSTSVTGRAMLDAAELNARGILRADSVSSSFIKKTPTFVRAAGRGLNALSVGMSIYSGYNRKEDATDFERVVHATTEGTIALAGVGVAAGVGAGVSFALAGTAVCPIAGTIAGLAVGIVWGFGMEALETTYDENGVSYMEHIDNASYDMWESYCSSYIDYAQSGGYIMPVN